MTGWIGVIQTLSGILQKLPSLYAFTRSLTLSHAPNVPSMSPKGGRGALGMPPFKSVKSLTSANNWHAHRDLLTPSNHTMLQVTSSWRTSGVDHVIDQHRHLAAHIANQIHDLAHIVRAAPLVHDCLPRSANCSL